jgi:leucyl aminopeptidase
VKYRITEAQGDGAEFPLLAVGVPKQKEKALPAALSAFDARSGGVLGRVFAAGDFTGARDETLVAYLDGGARRLLLVGTGKAEDVSRTSVRRAASIAARRARGLGTGAIAFELPSPFRGGLSTADFAQVAVEGMAQGAWQFDELKTPNEDRKPPVEAVTVVAEPGELPAAEGPFAVGRAIADGQALARRLQFLPPNRCTPAVLAETAVALGERHGFLVTVLDREDMRREGMGALLAVAQGTATEPRFITIEYRGAGEAAPPLCLVGKGVTFDTGGISIKPAAQMEDMKYDMSGAAAVLGAMEAVGQLRPKLNVVGVIPATDNMPSGSAIRPADVVKSHFGKYIEIVNTDAEGRLILADALSYIRRFKPAAALDAATLTGAALFVTGHVATPIMGNDEQLIEEVRRAGDRAGERCWPLPMFEEFKDQNKSDIADVKNSGGRPAGTITAGWFLREFVDGFPWVHLDVAGTAYSDADSPPLPKGPAGLPVRLFVEFLLGRAG